MGRWAENHDQRKGQWLINRIRSTPEFQQTCKTIASDLDLDVSYSDQEKHMVAVTLWDMTNEEFDRIMEEYWK